MSLIFFSTFWMKYRMISNFLKEPQISCARVLTGKWTRQNDISHFYMLFPHFKNWNMILFSFEECFDVDAKSIFIVSSSICCFNEHLFRNRQKNVSKRKNIDRKPVARIEISCLLHTLAFIQQIRSTYNGMVCFFCCFKQHQRLQQMGFVAVF